jgi:RNA polymerase sigma factor (sigma-70 family)
LNFRHHFPSKESMLDAERLPTNEPLASRDEAGLEEMNLNAPAEPEESSKEAAPRAAEVDAESLFAADLSATSVLTRAEETALAHQIARARKRLRAILRKARRLTRAALAEGGRGVVAPEEDFRERETVAILHYAKHAVRDAGAARAAGLARKELRVFIDQLSAALADYRALRDAMVRANVRLVSVLARRYRHPTLSFLDLFQEGTIGLLRAIEKYDPDRNVKFSTYATWWIWQQLGRAADTQGALIRTPVHWNQFRRRLSRHEQERAAENGGAVSREDRATMHGMDAARFEAMALAFHFVSTDAPANDDDDRILETRLAGTGIEPEEQALKNALREHLECALGQLPARESMILRQRFGLQDDASETLEQIGARLGVSRERIRQLESRALKHLKEVCTAQGLQDYLH